MKARASKALEFTFFQKRDDSDNFVCEFSSCSSVADHYRSKYELESLNTFYIQRRSKKTLHTLYALCIDIDGHEGAIPLSHLDILQRWRELGFPLPPTEIRRTSPGRFHVIIKIKPARAFPDKVSFWLKCSMGLFRAYAGLGADRSATTNPAGFVRIPGHANKKYLDRTSVEAVHKSESVTTLTDIHQTLIDAELIRPPIVRRNSISEDIAILEAGVPEGVRNHACFTLALHYKEQGIPERDALTRLLFWNDGLITPDYPSRVKASVRSAYHNDYKPSRAHLGRIADRARACQSKPVSASTKAPKSPRDKIREYAARIRRIIESCGGYMVISQRELSRSLNIPFRSFSHALELIPNLVVESYGKGRNATTTFRIDEHKPTLRLLSQESMPSLGEINDANK